MQIIDIEETFLSMRIRTQVTTLRLSGYLAGTVRHFFGFINIYFALLSGCLTLNIDRYVTSMHR